MNLENAKYLLLSVKEILGDIPFYLGFGTLLGAYRNGNFIEYDDDVDVILKIEYYPEVLGLVKSGCFAEYGLACTRSDGWTITFNFNGEHIDLYFFNRRRTGYYKCGRAFNIDNYQLDNPPTKINFLDTEFNTVSDIESYLLKVYGEDWRIPINKKGNYT